MLRGETCIAVSNFFVHKDYATIAPAYHCVPDVLGGHQGYVTEEYAIRWFREMEARTANAVMFLSCDDKAWIDREGLFKQRDVYYLQYGGNWEGVERNGVDLSGLVPRVSSVSVLALTIAVFMAFKEIYLLGCDHSWTQHFGVSAHFYPEEESVITTRPGYSESAGYDLGDQFMANWQMWNQYKAIRQYARARGISIFNATPDSMLDVFPRVQYEALFENDGERSKCDGSPSNP